MIELHQFPRALGLPNPSPFCLKVETYLRMTQTPYEVVVIHDPRKTPKGKLPLIVADGVTIADSRIIVDHLERTGPNPLDASLTPRDKALAHLLARSFEDNIYWIGVWGRWVDDEGWATVYSTLLASIPALVRPMVARMLRKRVLASTRAHGIGRHSREEIYAFAESSLAEVAAFLGDRPYFLGDAPSTLDATAFGILANLMWGGHPAALRAHVTAHSNLESYCQRLKVAYFSDMPEFTAGSRAA